MVPINQNIDHESHLNRLLKSLKFVRLCFMSEFNVPLAHIRVNGAKHVSMKSFHVTTPYLNTHDSHRYLNASNNTCKDSYTICFKK